MVAHRCDGLAGSGTVSDARAGKDLASAAPTQAAPGRLGGLDIDQLVEDPLDQPSEQIAADLLPEEGDSGAVETGVGL
jgi:hypothetical protein